MEVETERLRLRHYVPGDADDQLRVMTDPEFVRRMGPQFVRPTRDQILVGLGRIDEHWKRLGYGQWALRYGFRRAGLARVMAVTDKDNRWSSRVMERCGLRYERDDVYFGGPVVYYALNREDYEPDGSPYLERG